MTLSSRKNGIYIVLRHEIIYMYVCISKGSSLKLGNRCWFTVLVRGKFYSYTFLSSRNSILRKVPMKNLQLESDGKVYWNNFWNLKTYFLNIFFTFKYIWKFKFPYLEVYELIFFQKTKKVVSSKIWILTSRSLVRHFIHRTTEWCSMQMIFVQYKTGNVINQSEFSIELFSSEFFCSSVSLSMKFYVSNLILTCNLHDLLRIWTLDLHASFPLHVMLVLICNKNISSCT